MDSFLEASGQTLMAVALIAATLLAAWLAQAARAYLQTRTDLAKYNALFQSAYDYARAAQQLYESGQISKDARYQYVADLIRQQYPAMTDDKVRQIIETSVATLKIANDLTATN